ncbi:MAG: FecR domain-containing protein [Pseudomonadota bacterium]
MAESNADAERAEREAADWFTRLGSKVIATKAIEDFYAWRRDPLNNASYLGIEEVWSKTSRLQGDPDVDIAIHEALKRGAARRKAGLLADLAGKKGLGLAVILLAIIMGAYLITRPDGYATTVGEQRIVRLTDGTRVTLDTNSALTAHFTQNQRAVQLTRGKALFEVARDPVRPFVVSTDRGQVRALGTRFDVELRDADMKVTLLEGSVEVRDTPRSGRGGSWTLSPGEQVLVNNTARPMSPPRPVDFVAATSWTTGRLTFNETPLAEAVVEVNRYSREKIELKVGDFAARPVNGAFEAGDPEAFAGAVAALLDLEVTRPSSGKIVLQRPQSEGGV